MIKYINVSIFPIVMTKVDSFIKLHTLISLNKNERNGYELMKELESKLGRDISASHIYPFLKDLNKKNYVEYRKDGREKIYTLTRPGKKFVNETLLKFHEVIQESLARKITECTHCGCEVYNNKYTEKFNGKTLAFCCCHCADSYKKSEMNGRR